MPSILDYLAEDEAAAQLEQLPPLTLPPVAPPVAPPVPPPDRPLGIMDYLAEDEAATNGQPLTPPVPPQDATGGILPPELPYTQPELPGPPAGDLVPPEMQEPAYEPPPWVRPDGRLGFTVQEQLANQMQQPGTDTELLQGQIIAADAREQAMGRPLTPEEHGQALTTVQDAGELLAKAVESEKADRERIRNESNVAERGAKYAIKHVVPFGSSALKATQLTKVITASKRIESKDYDHEDLRTVAQFLVDTEEAEQRGFGGQVLDVMADMPAFIGEIALTGGAFTGGKVAAEAGAKKLLGTVAEKAAGKVATTVVGGVAGTAAITAANPQRVMESFAREKLPNFETIVDESGKTVEINLESNDDILMPLIRAYGDTMIELGTELAGGQLVKGAGKVASKVPLPKFVKEAARNVRRGAVRQWLSKPGRTIKSLQAALKKGGWNGVFGEILEERAGDVARIATTLQSPYDNPTGQLLAAAPYEALTNEDPGVALDLQKQALRQLAVEGAAFGALGAGMHAAGSLVDKGTNRRVAMERLAQKVDAGQQITRRNLEDVGESSFGTNIESRRVTAQKLVNRARGLETPDAAEQDLAAQSQGVMDAASEELAKGQGKPESTEQEAPTVRKATRENRVSDEEAAGMTAKEYAKSGEHEWRVREFVKAREEYEADVEFFGEKSDEAKASKEKMDDANVRMGSSGTLAAAHRRIVQRVEAKRKQKESKQKITIGSGTPAQTTTTAELSADTIGDLADKSLPPVEDGYTRLWRGGLIGDEGLWFHANLPEVAFMHFVNAEADGPSRITYVDIPTTDYEEGEYSPSEEDFANGSAEPGDQILPAGLAGSAKPFLSLEKTEAPTRELPGPKKPTESQKPPTPKEPAETISIMGVNSTLSATETVGGVTYDIFRGQEEGAPAAIRVTDADSGEVISLTQFPDWESAQAKWIETSSAAHKAERTPRTEEIEDEEEVPPFGASNWDDIGSFEELEELIIDSEETTKQSPPTPEVKDEEEVQQEDEDETAETPEPEEVEDEADVPEEDVEQPEKLPQRKGEAPKEGEKKQRPPKPKAPAESELSWQPESVDRSKLGPDAQEALRRIDKRYGNVDAKSPSNATEEDAQEFLSQRGLEAVFVDSDDPNFRVAGASHGQAVVIRSGMAEDALWRVVGHELAHGKGFDVSDELDESLIEEAAARRLERASPQYAKDMEDPDLRRREGIAELVGDFMSDRAFREKLQQDNPSLFARLRDAILELLGNFVPQSAANLAVLRFLRESKTDTTDEGATKEGKAKRSVAESQEKLADWVVRQLGAGEEFTERDFFDQADKAFGGRRSEGRYGDSEAYDALEQGVNRFFLNRTDPTVNAKLAKDAIAWIEEKTRGLPRHKTRTGEKDSLQQFSTPPAYAYLVNWLANLNNNDVVLEPSAGVGGLAVHAINSGADVYVNEIDEKRAALLRNLPTEKVFTEDAEQIAGILPRRMPSPTAVVMNPPFSRAGRRMGDKIVTGTDRKHIDQALLQMPQGGRLVAIIGAGLHGRGKAFDQWLSKLPYDVRADVEVGRDVYKGYGTTFPTRILVIDKAPRQSGREIVRGSSETLGGVVDLLEGVRNDRPKPEPAKPGELEGTSTLQGEKDRPTDSVQSPADTVDTKQPGKGPSVSSERVPGSTGGSGGHDVGLESDRGGRTPRGQRGKSGRTEADTTDTGSKARGESSRQSSKKPAGSKDTGDSVSVKAERKRSVKKELTEDTYEPYEPTSTVKGANKHPASLVESSVMAAIDYPEATYTPNIDPRVIAGYRDEDLGVDVGISDVQLEAIIYAGQAHSQLLPDGTRRAFMIGDGTGVGKAREVAGIILDNFRQGRKKAVWVSKSAKNFKPARIEFSKTGGDPSAIFMHGKVKSGVGFTASNGVAFTTYTTLGKEASKEAVAAGNALSRVDQIVDWVGEDFDGVLIFDESHEMGSAIDSGQGFSRKKASAKALAGVALQQKLPHARIVYLSATSATEVRNLAYATRLGLWGEGTPFANTLEFVNRIAAGGVAAMEKVAADMKALGMYLARSISYADVTYERLEHTLTSDQTKSYNMMADAWNIVLQNMNAALQVTGGPRGAAVSRLWSANQQFFNSVITSMQIPSVIKQMERSLADGKSVVIQLTNTNEAATTRALEGREENEDLEDIDVSPRYILMDYVERSFPTQAYEDYIDDNGNQAKRPVVDSNGNPVHNPQAVEMKENLLNQLGSLTKDIASRGAMDQIIDYFGEDAVGEVTGRPNRIIEVNGKQELQKRGSRAGEADIDSFMNGKKRILIFSAAGGTGLDYHADLSRKNQQQRHHILLQPGWRADIAVQGFGRTHRSNQASAPKYFLVQTNLKGQKRFISTIARRLAQLGALTKGQREAGESGLLTSADNLESTQAREALNQLWQDIIHGHVERFGVEFVREHMGLDLVDANGNTRADLPPMTKFLNRVLSMRVEDQNAIFEEFERRFEIRVDEARSQGTLDQGVETIHADHIVKKSEKVVYTHTSGAQAKHVVVTVSRKTKARTWDAAHKKIRTPNVLGYVKSDKTGHVWIVESTNTTVQTSDGRLTQKLKLHSPISVSYNNKMQMENSGNWTEVSEADAESNWNEQVENVPEFHDEDLHILSGVLLPVWDRLPESNTLVKRLLTDDGEQILGRVIPNNEIRSVLRKLGASMDAPKLNPQEAVDAVERGAVLVLANEWRIKRSKVDGEWLIELVGPGPEHSEELDRHGVFRRRPNYKTRYFIPTGEEAATTMEAVIRSRPIVDVLEPGGGQRGIAGIDTSPQPILGPKRPNIFTAEDRQAAEREAGEAVATPFTLSQRVKALLDKIGVPAAERYLPRRLLGVYKQRSKNVRVRSLSNIFVAAHEATHYISRTYGIGKRVLEDTSGQKAFKIHPLRKALTDIYEEYFPGGKRSHSPEKRIEEGMAVLFERYVYEPSIIDAKYPTLVDAFIRPGGKYYHPKFTQLLDGMADIIGEHARLSPEEQIGSRIVRGDEVVRKNRSFSVVQRAIFEAFNPAEPLNRAARLMGVKETTLDPTVWYYSWLDRGTVIANWITGTHTTRYDADGKLIREENSMATYIKMIDGREKLFDTILVARRVVEDHNRLMNMREAIDEMIADGAEESDYAALQADADRLESVLEKDEFNLAAATAVMDEYDIAGGWYRPAVKVYDSINERLIKMARDHGLISAKQATEWLNTKGYAAFLRHVHDDMLSDDNPYSASSQTKAKAHMNRTGSPLDIISPVFGQKIAVMEIVAKSMQNAVWSKMLKLADHNTELARRFERVETQRVPREGGGFTYPQDRDGNLVRVWVNGQRVFIKAAPEFRATMELMKAGSEEIWEKVMTFAAGTFTRLTTSANPVFWMGNIVVDQISAWMNTKVGYKPGIDPIVGIFDYIREMMDPENRQEFHKFLESGGKRMTLAASLQHATPEKFITGLEKPHGLVAKGAHIVDLGISVLEIPSNFSEYLTRWGEYKRSLAAGESNIVAMYRASEVTTPFKLRGAMGGRFGRAWIRSVPYTNAAFQVTYKFARAWQDNPVRAGTVSATIIMGALVSAISLMKFATDCQKRKLRSLNGGDLGRYLYFPNPLDECGLLRMRIPEQHGAITGPIYIYMMSHYNKDKVKLDLLLDTITQWVPDAVNVIEPSKMLIGGLPKIIQPSLQVGVSAEGAKTYPYNGPIVPKWQTDPRNRVKPADRYTKYTSRVAKAVGSMWGISPSKVDFWIRNQFGQVGGMATGNFPRISTFTRESELFMSGRLYNEFYDQKEKIGWQLSDAEKENTVYSPEEKAEVEETYKQYNQVSDALADIRRGDEIPEEMRQVTFDALLVLNRGDKIKQAELETFIGKAAGYGAMKDGKPVKAEVRKFVYKATSPEPPWSDAGFDKSPTTYRAKLNERRAKWKSDVKIAKTALKTMGITDRATAKAALYAEQRRKKLSTVDENVTKAGKKTRTRFGKQLDALDSLFK